MSPLIAIMDLRPDPPAAPFRERRLSLVYQNLFPSVSLAKSRGDVQCLQYSRLADPNVGYRILCVSINR
jgi:hypothetical protein